MHIGEQKMKWLSERLHNLENISIFRHYAALWYTFSILFGKAFKFHRNSIEITLLHRHITVIKMWLVNTSTSHYNNILERKTKRLIILCHEQLFTRSKVGSLNTTSRKLNKVERYDKYIFTSYVYLCFGLFFYPVVRCQACKNRAITSYNSMYM